MKATAFSLLVCLVAAISTRGQTGTTTTPRTQTKRVSAATVKIVPLKVPLRTDTMLMQRTIGTNSQPVDVTNSTAKLRSTNLWAFEHVKAGRPITLSKSPAFAHDKGLLTDGGIGSSGEAKLCAALNESPMQWSKELSNYSTILKIGYTNGSKTGPPVGVQLQGQELRLQTNNIVITGPGVDRMVEVKIYSDKYQTNAGVKAMTDIGDQTFLVAMETPELSTLQKSLIVLFGATLGGGLNIFKRKSAARPWYWYIAQGWVAGFLVLAVVAGLGVSLPTGPVKDVLTQPWTMLAVTAIGGFGGAPLFAKISKIGGGSGKSKRKKG